MLLVPLAMIGCEHYKNPGRFTDLNRVQLPEPAAPQTLNVHFLGTAGLYLQADGVSVLADPFFSNPCLLRVVTPISTKSNTQRINEETARLPGLQELQAIIVTHSHYDHAMDLPYIIEKLKPELVYGSKTLQNILAPLVTRRFYNLDDTAHDPTQSHDNWIPVAPRVRIAAIKAQHFPHFMGHHYAFGGYTNPLCKVPSKLYDWLEGDTYSFVIDILDKSEQDTTVFRIFYMPSASTHPAGTPPAVILDDGKRVDLAIIGASQIEKDVHYPGDLLRRIRPREVMLVHWDNLFDDYRTTRTTMNFRVDPNKIAKRITNTIGAEPKVYWPQRGAVLNLSMPDKD